MKQLKLKSMMAVLVTLFSLYAHAYDVEIDGIYYNLDENQGTAEVTYNKEDLQWQTGSYNGKVLIPSDFTYNGKKYHVTDIGASAFTQCYDLIAVTIPSSVQRIGKWAFHKCTALTSVVIPEGVTYIGPHAFDGCSKLETVTIPEGVTTIEASTFSISGLTSVTIPNSVTTIEDGAFSLSKNLASVAIPRSVEKIGFNAFGGCDNLSSVYITDLSAWCNISFAGGESATPFIVPTSNPLRYASMLFLNGEEVKNLIIPSDVKVIRKNAFCGFSGLNSVTIPDNVEQIEDYAFAKCSNLISIHFPDRIKLTRTTLRAESSDRIPSLYVHNGTQSLLELLTWEYFEIYDETTKKIIPPYRLLTSASSCTFELGFFETPTGNASLYSLNGFFYGRTDVDKADKQITDNALPSFTFSGLAPNTEYGLGYNYCAVDNESDQYYYFGSLYTMDKALRFKTQALQFKTSNPQVAKSGKVILTAEANLADGEENAGFEWKKVKETGYGPSTRESAAIYGGKMELSVNDLDASSHYMVRPYYHLPYDTYYGDWVDFIPDNASYCEPTVHTYANAVVEGNKANLSGSVVEGTDDILEQGFEVRKDADGPTDVCTIVSTGQKMTASITDLSYETIYKYRAYVKTSKKTYYGEELTLKVRNFSSDPESIEAASSVIYPKAQQGVHTLTGSKVSDDITILKSLPRGIYLVNGKKIWVK